MRLSGSFAHIFGQMFQFFLLLWNYQFSIISALNVPFVVLISFLKWPESAAAAVATTIGEHRNPYPTPRVRIAIFASAAIRPVAGHPLRTVRTIIAVWCGQYQWISAFVRWFLWSCGQRWITNGQKAYTTDETICAIFNALRFIKTWSQTFDAAKIWGFFYLNLIFELFICPKIRCFAVRNGFGIAHWIVHFFRSSISI